MNLRFLFTNKVACLTLLTFFFDLDIYHLSIPSPLPTSSFSFFNLIFFLLLLFFLFLLTFQHLTPRLRLLRLVFLLFVARHRLGRTRVTAGSRRHLVGHWIHRHVWNQQLIALRYQDLHRVAVIFNRGVAWRGIVRGEQNRQRVVRGGIVRGRRFGRSPTERRPSGRDWQSARRIENIHFRGLGTCERRLASFLCCCRQD